MTFEPRVSIIVPTFNEAEDIARTLDALSRIHYPNFEVIVVDGASTDQTVEIVSCYVHKFQFKLIRQPINLGVASGRNVGIQAATGEILVILNADVFPGPDFLERTVPHYQNACDYLLVESQVANQEFLFPRFSEAEHHFRYDGQTWINWTEGFSCRTSAALAVGLFPEEIPGAAGEDAILGEKLEKQFRKVIDKSIRVPHIAPATLRGYWNQRLGRGRGVSFRRFYADHASRADVLVLCLKCSTRAMLDTMLILPLARYALRLSRFSKRGRADFFSFWWASLIQRWGETIGMWSGFARLADRPSALR